MSVAATSIAVYPQLGQTYPDADNVPITSVGALVSVSDYILLAIDEGYLLTSDPLNVGEPDDRTDIVTPQPLPDLGGLEAVAVFPQEGRTYPDANSVPITAVGAIVDISPYILNAIDEGYLLTSDPLNVYLPDDRTGGSGGGAPADAGYVTIGGFLGLSAERSLTAGAGISITDNGPESTVVIATTNVGDVVGPAIAADHALARFDGATGKLIQSGPAVLTDGGALSGLTAVSVTGNIAVTGTVDGVDVSALNSTVAGKVTGPTVVPVTDNAITRFDGTTGLLVQNSVVTIGDTGSVAGVTSLDVVGNITVSGTVDGVDVSADHAVAYVTVGNTATLPNERALAATAPIVLTDGGAGASATLSAPTVVVGPVSAGDNQIVRFDGTTGKLIQDGINNPSIDDSGNIVMVGAATVDGVDVSALAAVPYVTIGNSATTTAERALTGGAGITVTDGGANGAVTVAQNQALNAQTNTSYTLVLADAGKQVQLHSTTPVTLTIPNDASVAFPAGTVIDVLATNFGVVDIQGDTSVIILTGNGQRFTTPTPAAIFVAGIYDRVRLTKMSANQWNVTGGLERFVTTLAATTLTLAGLHVDNQINTTSASATTITIPQASVSAGPFPIGCTVVIHQLGAGQVTVAAGVGVTLNVPSGFTAKTRNQYSEVTLTQVSLNTWDITGSLEDSTSYLTLGTTAAYPNERVLTAGTNISFVDGGAGSTLTITSSAGVAGTQAVVATQGSGQAISAATPTTITLGTEVSDTGNNFAANTYTVPATGLYQININLTVTSAATTGAVYLAIGGTQQVPGANMSPANGGFLSGCLSFVKSLTAAQALTMSATMTNASTVSNAQFDIHRIA